MNLYQFCISQSVQGSTADVDRKLGKEQFLYKFCLNILFVVIKKFTHSIPF